jgi:hypothetical protein
VPRPAGLLQEPVPADADHAHRRGARAAELPRARGAQDRLLPAVHGRRRDGHSHRRRRQLDRPRTRRLTRLALITSSSTTRVLACHAACVCCCLINLGVFFVKLDRVFSEEFGTLGFHVFVLLVYPLAYTKNLSVSEA